MSAVNRHACMQDHLGARKARELSSAGLLAIKRQLNVTTLLRLACCAVMAASGLMLLAMIGTQQLLPQLLRRSYPVYDAQESAPARPWLLSRTTSTAAAPAVVQVRTYATLSVLHGTLDPPRCSQAPCRASHA